MEKLQGQCATEWRAMSEVERHAWKIQGEAKRLTAIVAQHADRALVLRQQPPPFELWAGCGSRKRPAPTEPIADDLRSTRREVLRRLRLPILLCLWVMRPSGPPPYHQA